MNTILRKAGQVAQKVNKTVNPMVGFFKKSNQIHICCKCGAEYFGDKIDTCQMGKFVGDPCGSTQFRTANSLSKAKEIHVQNATPIQG